MRFTYIESMCNPEYYVPLAKAAEELGFSTFGMPDSIIYPKESDTKYPYTQDGDREFLEDKPIIEPFVLASHIGAVTSTLKFLPFVMKLPVRDPVLAAKSAASVAVMTNNRFTFGIGLSPWPEDYAATGTQWPKRGKRFNEMIDIVSGLLTGEYFSYEGEFYNIPTLKICPTPSEKVPLIIGGHSDAALKRAARMGDGWAHAGGDPEELKVMIAKLNQFRKDFGRDSEPFQIHASSISGFSAGGINELEDMGITDLIIGFHNTYQMDKDEQTLQEKLDMMRGYADSVIAKCS